MGKIRTGIALLGGLALGGMVGAVAGVLFAPQEGSKTREEVKTKVKKIQKEGVKAFNKLKTRELEPAIKKLSKAIAENAKPLSEKVKQEIKNLQKEMTAKAKNALKDADTK